MAGLCVILVCIITFVYEKCKACFGAHKNHMDSFDNPTYDKSMDKVIINPTEPDMDENEYVTMS